MPFTPYTSQTILPSANGVVDQQHASIQQQQPAPPTSFFTRRPAASSPIGSPPDANQSLPPSPPSRFNTLLPSTSNVAPTSFTIDAVEAWGKTTLDKQHSTLYLLLTWYQTPIFISAHQMAVYCILYLKNNQNQERYVFVHILVMGWLIGSCMICNRFHMLHDSRTRSILALAVNLSSVFLLYPKYQRLLCFVVMIMCWVDGYTCDG